MRLNDRLERYFERWADHGGEPEELASFAMKVDGTIVLFDEDGYFLATPDPDPEIGNAHYFLATENGSEVEGPFAGKYFWGFVDSFQED